MTDPKAFAMRLSMGVGVLMLAGKVTAYLITGAAAILSDAAESVIHVAAVAFASYSLRLSSRPAGEQSPYGYERIAFFSAGFEGAMIVIAGLAIIVAAIYKILYGFEIERLGTGTVLIAAASMINLTLGWYLIRIGRRNNSLILVANGNHVLTDSWTSFGVVAGLLLVIATGQKLLDPIIAIVVACNILWTGGKLVRTSILGLMDIADPARARVLRQAVERACRELDCEYHLLRFRDAGEHTIVHLHLLLRADTPLGVAHRIATDFEDRVKASLDFEAEIVTHLEAREDHDSLHPGELT